MIVFGEVDMVGNQITGASGRISAHAAAMAIALSDLAAHHPGKSNGIRLYGFPATPGRAIGASAAGISSVIGRWHNNLRTFATAKNMTFQDGWGSPDWLATRFTRVPIAFNLFRLLLPLLPISLAFATAKAMFVLLDLAGLAIKNIATLFTGNLHGISSNEKTLVGHTSDWCRSNQDDRTRVKHNDTRARQWAQSGCYLIASTGVL